MNPPAEAEYVGTEKDGCWRLSSEDFFVTCLLIEVPRTSGAVREKNSSLIAETILKRAYMILGIDYWKTNMQSDKDDNFIRHACSSGYLI